MCGDPKNFISISTATVYGREALQPKTAALLIKSLVFGSLGKARPRVGCICYIPHRLKCFNAWSSGRKAVLEESGIFGRWSLTGGSGSQKVEPGSFMTLPHLQPSVCPRLLRTHCNLLVFTQVSGCPLSNCCPDPQLQLRGILGLSQSL